jgi:hypothetical protein
MTKVRGNLAMRLVCCVLLGLLPLTLHAATIVSLTGPPGPCCLVASDGIPYAFGWSQTSSISQITIAAELEWSTTTVDIYLTDSIGPSTTVADQLAFAEFSFESAEPAWVVLFSGLDLGPGSYFVTIAGSAVGWVQASPPTVTTMGGAGYLGEASWFPGATYPPSSFIGGLLPGGDFIFEVVSTPEPVSFGLVALGIAACALPQRWGRRR